MLIALTSKISDSFSAQERKVALSAGRHRATAEIAIFLPVALASMTSKYLREAAMRPFNEFWCARVPGLKPTAGYPVDSRRFKQQIAAVQQELAIDDQILWRSR